MGTGHGCLLLSLPRFLRARHRGKLPGHIVTVGGSWARASAGCTATSGSPLIPSFSGASPGASTWTFPASQDEAQEPSWSSSMKLCWACGHRGLQTGFAECSGPDVRRSPCLPLCQKLVPVHRLPPARQEQHPSSPLPRVCLG